MIEKVRTSLEEQETTINLFPKQMGEWAYVWSADPVVLNRMWKLHKKYPGELEVVNDSKYGTGFNVPRDWISIKPKRKVSEEQRQKLVERLAGNKN